MPEARTARQMGRRLLDDNGQDAELTAPFTLACAFDGTFQRAVLDAAEFVPSDSESRRNGLPEEVFEQAWQEAARSLAPLIEEAANASTAEVAEALRSSNSDCSIALLSLLHDKGDIFQQQCMETNAIELARRRQERTLSRVVQEAARQNCLPPDLSSKRMIRILQKHLPLTEIMGHRYRLKEKGGEQHTDARRVSFSSNRSNQSPRSSSGRRSKRRGDASDQSEDSEEESSGSESESDSQSDDADDKDDGYNDDDSSVGSSSRDGSHRESGTSASDTSSSEDSSDDSDSSSDRKSKKRKRSKRKRRSNMVAVPPSNWIDGDAPEAGFYLETFTKIYQQYMSFTKLHRDTGLTFRSLIQPCLKPTVLMELGVTSLSKLTQDDLLRRIKERLGFNDEDYYTRKLELLRLPPCDQSRATQLYKSFRKLSSPMLRIIAEAEDCGVKLRTTNLSRIFKNHIRGWPSLERWFGARRFENFSAALRYVSTQIHDRIAKEMEERHEDMIMRGQVAGARSDIRGGKSESSQGGQFRHQNQNRGQGRNSDTGARPNRSAGGPPQSSGNRTFEQRPASGGATGGRYPARSAKEEDAFQAAIAKEKALPRGMYFHPRGPFCKENPCKAKVCQGCNYHADAEGRGHIRPNCRCKEHPDFVASGYFHERHPNQQGALSLPKRQDDSNTAGNYRPRPPPTAQVRNVGFNRRQHSGRDPGAKAENAE